ncbi:hypothetical protein [Streptomyces sp. 6-11-2]|nr:hypothetical protein [Streptomyces sp. 6-11-2]
MYVPGRPAGIVSGRLAHRVGKPLVIVGTALTAVGLAATSLRA